MLLYLIILFFLLVFTMILILPLRLYINTDTGIYYTELRGIIRAGVFFSEEELVIIKLRILFFTKIIRPLEGKKKAKKKKPKKEKPEKKKKEKKKKKFGPDALKLIFRMIRDITGTFKIRELKAAVDTGNPALNGILIPVFSGVNKKNIDLNINFFETNFLILCIENRLISIIYVAVKYFIKLKKYF